MSNARSVFHMLKKYDKVISDEECKELCKLCDVKELAERLLERGKPFSNREIEIIARAAGIGDSDEEWCDDEVLEKYADFVHNYTYTYNDEALKVDPSIDTKKQHIGTMAQDLEKVNDAVVNEDTSGYKTVDTGRLALMNAGAIAELARRVEELEKNAKK